VQLQIDALKEAAAWPGAGRRTLVVLASQLMAAELYQEGFGYFAARSDSTPAARSGWRSPERSSPVSAALDRGGDRQAGRGHRPRSRAAALLPGNLAGPAPRLRGPRGDRRRRHVPVAGCASPDDLALAQYWADRRRRQQRKARPWHQPPNAPCAPSTDGAPGAGELLLYADRPPDSPRQWETWFRVIRTAITRQAITVQAADDRTGDQYRLMHTGCQPPARRPRSQDGTPKAEPARPLGCFSPVPRRVARRVVRGRGRSNAPRYPTMRITHTIGRLGRDDTASGWIQGTGADQREWRSA